jgi:hypothetical protein
VSHVLSWEDTVTGKLEAGYLGVGHVCLSLVSLELEVEVKKNREALSDCPSPGHSWSVSYVEFVVWHSHRVSAEVVTLLSYYGKDIVLLYISHSEENGKPL